MRLRITRQLCDSIDGIEFSSFRCGYVYEVGTTVANYLLSQGAAELVESDEPTIVLPPEKHLFHPANHAVELSGKSFHPGEAIAVAADRAPRLLRQRQIKLHRQSPRSAPSSDLHDRIAALSVEIQRIKEDLARLRSAT